VETKLRFVDLFAGLGGFHVALSKLGHECVFASELNPTLQDIYETNFGIRPHGDIRDVNVQRIPDHDVLTAGFPCQPFSKAGEQLGFDCTEQGTLFNNVAEILNVKRPSFFILENVPNLLKHDAGKTWERIQKDLKERGYYIDATRLSPHKFGIPQVRDRVYIVGSTKPLSDFAWPPTSDSEPSIDDVLDEYPADAKPLSSQTVECLETWNKFLHAMPRDVDVPWFPMWSMEWGATYPFEDETPWAVRKRGLNAFKGFKGSHGVKLGYLRTLDERWACLPSHARTEEKKFPKWKQDFIRQNRDFYQDNKAWIDRWLPKILKFPSSLQKLEWNVKGGNRDIWEYVIQFRASGVRVKRRTSAPSLIAMTETQVPIIAWQKRYMTPQECARLQSLESLKTLPGSSAKAFAALGNAVNSKVVLQVAEALLRTQAVANSHDRVSEAA